jgi:hypothetical protein
LRGYPMEMKEQKRLKAVLNSHGKQTLPIERTGQQILHGRLPARIEIDPGDSEQQRQFRSVVYGCRQSDTSIRSSHSDFLAMEIWREKTATVFKCVLTFRWSLAMSSPRTHANSRSRAGACSNRA